MAEPSTPHVHLRFLSALPIENWDQFEGLLRASIVVSRIHEVHHQRAWYLHQHFQGNALNFYLRLREAMRNNLYNLLQEVRNRYAGADQRRNFELDLQSTKFDLIKEQPDNSLTDQKRLVNLA